MAGRLVVALDSLLHKGPPGRDRWAMFEPTGASSGGLVPGRRLSERGWRPVGAEGPTPELAVTVRSAEGLSVHHQFHPGRVAQD
jgi:hypothetical protein